MELHESSSDSEESFHVKSEPREEDIKGYAENTMNELLAIYGYEKVDEGVTKELRLQHFSDKDDKREGSQDGMVIKQEIDDEECYDVKPHISDHEMSDGELPELQINEQDDDADLQIGDGQIGGYQTGGYQMSGPSSPTDDHLNNSSGTSASAYTSAECSDGENNPNSGYEIICAWCQQYGYKRYTLNTTTESKAFCSEKCFAACRRAYFRRNKVCDWCRHIRHTKEYIYFQDGDRKLQFCSEKCLHQYKMDVFCQETQTLGSSSTPSVESGSALEPDTPREHSGEAERGDSSMLLSVAADSSSQPYMLRNGVHQAAAAAPQGKDWTAATAPTQPKSKQQVAKTVFASQQVPIAPKVSLAGSPVLNTNVSQVGPTPTNMTLQNVIPTRVTPANNNNSPVIGLQTILQPGVGNSQIVGRTPVVVRGTHWPPVVRQIPGYVLPGQQPSPAVAQHPRRILPAPVRAQEASAAGSKKAADSSAAASQKSNASEVKFNESSEAPGLSHLLPPVTVMVPQPVFIPVPYPVPIPVPVPEETFHAMRASLASGRQSPYEASSSTSSERGKPKSSSTQHNEHLSSSLDFHPERYPPSVFRDSYFHRQNDSEFASGGTSRAAHKRHHGFTQHRDPPKINEPVSCSEETQQKDWHPFYKYKTLQRSASMDLSLARSSDEVGSRSFQKPARSDQDPSSITGRSGGCVGFHQDAYLTPDATVHLSGESSAKVRQALRCHLTKRLSQSALNLTEVGRMPNPQDDLRRCQSLSRLRYLEPNHMEKLPELTDGCSSPSHCSSASSTQKSNTNPTDKQSENPEEETISIKQEDTKEEALEVASDEDSVEPESKRKRLNHD